MNNNNSIRIGTVSSVNPKKATARILLEDRDNLVTAEFKLVFSRTLGIQDYSMVSVGEQVICLCLNNGLEEGYIIGSYYTDNILPPANDGNKRLIRFEDGSIVEYDNGDITIKAAKSITIEAPVPVKINGNLEVNGSIKASGSIIDTTGNTSNHSH